MNLRRALAAGAVLSLTACAAPLAPGAPKVVPSVTLTPYAEHRECVDLAPGDRLEYLFEASDPITFNIHYREAGLTVMPITRSRVTEDSGVYAPPVAQIYCLAWEAGAAGALIAYRVTLRRGGR